MSNLTSALIIVMSINCLLFLGQMAIIDINPQATTFYHCEGNIYGQLEANNCRSSTYLLNDSNPSSMLPSGETSISPDTGNLFTDIFTASKNFFLNTLGLGYVISILSAPSTFLKALNLPTSFVFGISALWYGLTFFLIVAFIFGRDA